MIIYLIDRPRVNPDAAAGKPGPLIRKQEARMESKPRETLFESPGDPAAGTLPFRAGYRQMVLEYYVGRTRRLREERQARLEAVDTRAGAERYREEARAKIRRAFGPLPERTPLNTRVTGTLERPGLRIEKLTFESRPGVLVTANLYLPEGKGPFPGVIGTCGHSAEGKAAGRYQAFCRRLARAGFAVLIYDPLSQGERDQYFRLPEGERVRVNCCSAHNMMGKQLELTGDFFGAWRAWDGMRALDCLLERPEINPEQLAVTGNSGGGTMTTWLWPLEERFRAAAPSCFVTTFLSNLENQLPSDCEQCPPGVLAAGLDMGDFILARAPEPVILLGQHYDFFDQRGLRKTFAEVKRFYRLFGAGDRAALFIGPHNHGYHDETQEAMVSFFCRAFGKPAPAAGPAPDCEETATLFAVPGGQVVAAGARPLPEINAERAAAMAGAREKAGPDRLREKIARVLVLPERNGPPHHRVLRRPTGRDGKTFFLYALDTEPGIQVILRRLMAGNEDHSRGLVLEPAAETTLYLPHVSAELEMAAGEFPCRAGNPGAAFALDPRGLGASLPEEQAPFFDPYGMDYMFHAWALMLGESYLGRRLHDVLSALDLLAGRGAQSIDLSGYGQGALLAVLAAVMHPAAGRVRTREMPPSWLEMARAPQTPWPAACFPRGVLAEFDLPDCLEVLGGRLEKD